KIVNRQDGSGDDEPWDPPVVGFRTQVTSTAVVKTTWANSSGFYEGYNTGEILSLVGTPFLFRDVRAISIGDWLGCDPRTFSLKSLKSADLPAARCDLNQTPMDIDVIGVLVVGGEHDSTSSETTRDLLNDAISQSRSKLQSHMRKAG